MAEPMPPAAATPPAPPPPPPVTEDRGRPLMSWDFPEYRRFQRPRRWYIVMGSIVGIFAVIAVFQRNPLFLIILLLSAFILFVQEARLPRRVTINLTDRGAEIGPDFFLYADLDAFWLAYDPPEVEKLYLQQKAALRPPIGVPLEGRNPVKIREILRQFLKEDLSQEEPGVDQASRHLRIS